MNMPRRSPSPASISPARSSSATRRGGPPPSTEIPIGTAEPRTARKRSKRMKKPVGLALASVALGMAVPASASELTERELSVPGFADFLAVDGDTVWTTNAGRVEQWSTEGKLAEVAKMGRESCRERVGQYV